MLRRLIIAGLILLDCNILLHGQVEWDPSQLDAQVLEESDAERSVEEIPEDQEDIRLRRNPILLNGIQKESLDRISWLTETEKLAIVRYCNQEIVILSPLELQILDEISPERLRKILPYLKVSTSETHNRFHLSEFFQSGSHQVNIRWRRDLYRSEEYQKEAGQAAKFAGSADKVFFRYRSYIPGKYSFGVISEKDEGEKLWQANSSTKVDYLSAHLYLERPTEHIDAVVVGDYRMRIGQGLILDNAFQNTRSFDYGMFIKNDDILRPYQSLQENQMLRGTAVKFKVDSKTQSTLFYSKIKTDANILDQDSLDLGEDELVYTSIITSGLHRTTSEIQSKNKLEIQDWGAKIKRKFHSGYLSAGFLSTSLSGNKSPAVDPYKIFETDLSHQQFLSLSHQWKIGGFHSFGELASDHKFHSGLIQGILKSLGKFSEMAIIYRRFSPQFQSLRSQTISINGRSSNEEGIFFGLNTSWSRSWKVGTYFDSWRHPWLRYRVDLPSYGNSWSVRIQYIKKRTWQAYLQYRFRITEQNHTISNLTQIQERANQNLRLHFDQKLNASLSIRSRIELHKHDYLDQHELGWLMYLDLIFKNMEQAISGNMRFMLFDIPSYDSRIYAYENDIPGVFRIPAYFGKGSLAYVNFRYRPFGRFYLEGRYSVLYKSRRLNPEAERIYDSEIHLQIQYRF